MASRSVCSASPPGGRTLPWACRRLPGDAGNLAQADWAFHHFTITRSQYPFCVWLPACLLSCLPGCPSACPLSCLPTVARYVSFLLLFFFSFSSPLNVQKAVKYNREYRDSHRRTNLVQLLKLLLCRHCGLSIFLSKRRSNRTSVFRLNTFILSESCMFFSFCRHLGLSG